MFGELKSHDTLFSILAVFLLFYRHYPSVSDLVWFPVAVAVEFVFATALALLLSALTVHFRDIRDILSNVLTLWFFATPIIYPISQAPERVRRLLNLNPFTHLAVAYQEVLFRPGPFAQVNRLIAVAVASIVVFLAGYFVFDRLRDTLPEEV